MDTNRTRFALLALFVVVVGSLTTPVPAHAAVTYRDASAGAACHAANGSLATKFNFNLSFLTNAGTVDAYVICSLPMDDATASPLAINKVKVHAQLPNADTTLTCTAQTSAYFGGENHVYYSSTKTFTSTGPNANFTLLWTGADLTRQDVYAVLSFNCKVPPGAKLGLIERWEGLEG